MANARKCDRCHAFYEEYGVENDSENVNAIRLLNLDSKREYYTQDIFDLCPACMNGLKRFLHIK